MKTQKTAAPKAAPKTQGRRAHNPAVTAAHKAAHIAREAERQKRFAQERTRRHDLALQMQFELSNKTLMIAEMPHRDVILSELHLPDGTPLIKHRGEE